MNSKKKYQCKVGYSDHTLNIHALKIAIAMGVNSIEFHYTLNRADTSFRDNLVSLELNEVSELRLYENRVREIKGSPIKVPTESELSNGHVNSFRRGCYAAREFKKGEKITIKDIKFLRPYVPNTLSPLDFSDYQKSFEILSDVNELDVLTNDNLRKTDNS